MIDTQALERGTAGEGPMHSLVVTGISQSKVAANNPWGQQHQIFNRDEFYDAWNARKINQVVRVDIAEQTTLQRSIPTEDKS